MTLFADRKIKLATEKTNTPKRITAKSDLREIHSRAKGSIVSLLKKNISLEFLVRRLTTTGDNSSINSVSFTCKEMSAPLNFR